MKRTLSLFIPIVFFTTSFLSIVGCNNHKTTKTKDKLRKNVKNGVRSILIKENGSGNY